MQGSGFELSIEKKNPEEYCANIYLEVHWVRRVLLPSLMTVTVEGRANSCKLSFYFHMCTVGHGWLAPPYKTHAYK